MNHIIRIGEDGYEGSRRWCVHCSCGWSGTFEDRYRNDGRFGYYISESPARPRVYRTREQAELIYAEHLLEVGRAEQKAMQST